jgi:hypothetical protein
MTICRILAVRDCQSNFNIQTEIDYSNREVAVFTYIYTVTNSNRPSKMVKET